MTRTEREFLRLMVRERAPRKALEVGVASGASSAVILGALRDGGRLFSIDYLKGCLGDTRKETGWACKLLMPDRLGAWELFTGGLAAEFMDRIGGGIELLFLDTRHIMPGELLDFLMVAPYLARNAVIVIHDVSAAAVMLLKQDDPEGAWQMPCRLLLSILPGEKLVPSATEYAWFPNIGAVRLGDGLDGAVDDIMGLLTLPWRYTPREADIEVARASIERHYGMRRGEEFTRTAAVQREMLDAMEATSPLWALARKTARFLDRRLFRRGRLE